jgi:integrase
LTFDHSQQREGHWAIVDLIGKGGHVRTIPLPGWVRQVLDDWFAGAGISSGKLSRRVNRAGRVWGEGMTEKVVWHVVKGFAKKVGIPNLAPHDLRRYADLGIVGERAPGSATPREVNWSRSNSCWAMFPCRRRTVTWDASS